MHKLRRNLNINLLINHGPTGRYGCEETVFVVKKRGESLAHVAMKLLAYIRFYHPELQIEVSAGQHYKPDLVRVDHSGDPVQWIECGSTSYRKLDVISSRNAHTLIDIVKPSPGEMQRYRREALKRIRRPDRVRFVAPMAGDLERFEKRLCSRHSIVATVPKNGERLFLEIDGETVEIHLVVKSPVASLE